MKFTLFIIAFAGCVFAAPKKDSLAKLPTYVKTCPRDLPGFDECLKGALQDILPYLARGIKDLNIPPIDPLYIEHGIYEFGAGAVQGKLIVKDAYSHGLGKSVFKSVKTNFDDPNNMEIDVDFLVPAAAVVGHYKQEGKFLGARFNGKGDFNITNENVATNWKLTGALHGRDGNKFFRVKNFIVTPIPEKMFIDATNLFNGNTVLSESVLNIVNGNWRATYMEMLPYTQEVWTKLFTELANRVFLRVPFDDLFPVSQ